MYIKLKHITSSATFHKASPSLSDVQFLLQKMGTFYRLALSEDNVRVYRILGGKNIKICLKLLYYEIENYEKRSSDFVVLVLCIVALQNRDAGIACSFVAKGD